MVATGDVTLKLIAALTNHGTLAAGKTLSVTSQNAITNGGVMQGDAMVLGAGEAFTNNGTLTAGKGNSVFSAQRLFLNAPGSLQGGGDVSLNSRSDITISGFTGTAGSLTMNVAGTLLNSALIYAGNNLKLFTDRLHNQHGDILAGNSLWVQKDASGGANTEIINNSGNIETHQGDIVVRTGHLLNQREGFSATTTTRTNPSSIQGMGNALVDIPLSLLPDGSYGYFTREVENQHGTPCNGHGACNITMDTLYYYAPFADSATQRFLSSQNITTVTGADNPAGRIASGRNLSAEAERLENRASFILANGDIALSGRELSNQSWGQRMNIWYTATTRKRFTVAMQQALWINCPCCHRNLKTIPSDFHWMAGKKITRPVRRIIPLFRRAGMLRPVLPAVSITEQPLHMQVVSVRWSLHLY